MSTTDATSMPHHGDRTFVTAAVAMLATQSLTSFAWQTIPSLAPAAAPSLGISAQNIGFLTSIVYLFAGLSAAAGGALAGRIGGIRVSQAALLACALGVALFGCGSLLLVPLVGVLIGCGYGPATPASSQILARVTPPRLTNLVFSIKQTGLPLGGALAGISVPWLERAWGWQATTTIVAVVCLAVVACLFPLRRTYDVENKGGNRASLSLADFWHPAVAVWRDPLLRRMAFVSIFFSATQGSLVVFIVEYGVSRLGMTLIEAGALAFLLQMSGVAGRLVWAFFADRLGGARRVLLILAVAVTCGLVVLALADPTWPRPVFVVLVAFLGITGVSWTGVYLAEVARMAPAGTVEPITGGMTLYTFSGPLLFPTLVSGALWLTGSYAIGFGLLALGTATSAFLMLGLVKARPDAG